MVEPSFRRVREGMSKGRGKIKSNPAPTQHQPNHSLGYRCCLGTVVDSEKQGPVGWLGIGAAPLHKLLLGHAWLAIGFFVRFRIPHHLQQELSDLVSLLVELVGELGKGKVSGRRSGVTKRKQQT